MASDERRRHAAAIQRAFRGWRARRRVVWAVRAQVEALEAEIQREVGASAALAGVAVGHVEWLQDGGRDRRLHLPRIRDSVFGVIHAFPPPREDTLGEDCALDDAVEIPREKGDGFRATGDDAAPVSPSSRNSSSGGAGSSLGSPSSSSNNNNDSSTRGRLSPGKLSDAGDASKHDSGALLTARDDARASSPDSSRHLTRLHSDEHGHAMDAETKQPGRTADSSALGCETSIVVTSGARLSVDEVLATHSKKEILLELQWARHALRERRKSLRERARQD